MRCSIVLATLVSFGLTQGTAYTYSDGSSLFEYYISTVVYYEPSSFVSIYSSPQSEVFSTNSLEVLSSTSEEHSFYYDTNVPPVSAGTGFVWNTTPESSTILYTSGDGSSYYASSTTETPATLTSFDTFSSECPSATATSGFDDDDDEGEDAWDPELLEAMEYWVSAFNNTDVLSFDETITAAKQLANGDEYANSALPRRNPAAVKRKKRPASRTPKPKMPKSRTPRPKTPKHRPSPKPKHKCPEPKKSHVCPVPPRGPPTTHPRPYTWNDCARDFMEWLKNKVTVNIDL
ncbi:hypothetical protein MFRU_036g00170 [Monilinia fructicola]|nr:hypothetical protein MFRU_036g00170 [Monilinia fructicola]